MANQFEEELKKAILEYQNDKLNPEKRKIFQDLCYKFMSHSSREKLALFVGNIILENN